MARGDPKQVRPGVWRFRLDLGRRPDGTREQRSVTVHGTKRDAIAERATLVGKRHRGELVSARDRTVREVAEGWLAGRRNIRPATVITYRTQLDLLLDHVGDVRLSKLTKSHLDGAVAWALERGRRTSQRRGRLTPGTVRESVARLKAVLEVERKQGHIIRNPCDLVEIPTHRPERFRTWTAVEASTFLAAVQSDRLYACWLLSLLGLRRSEVCGLRWSDVDLVGTRAVEDLGWPKPTPTLTVAVSRTDHGEGRPKSERSGRTLPLDPDLVTALERLQLTQRTEQIEAGRAYEVCRACGGAHLAADALGWPVAPRWYSERWKALSVAAGVPPIRLREARHTTAVILRRRGVDAALISAWLGHAQVSMTMNIYASDPQWGSTGATTAATLRDALSAQPLHKPSHMPPTTGQ